MKFQCFFDYFSLCLPWIEPVYHEWDLLIVITVWFVQILILSWSTILVLPVVSCSSFRNMCKRKKNWLTGKIRDSWIVNKIEQNLTIYFSIVWRLWKDRKRMKKISIWIEIWKFWNCKIGKIKCFGTFGNNDTFSLML